MNILSIGKYDGNLSIYEAQIKQFIIMHHQGVKITIQGNFSQEIETLLLNNQIPIIKDYPESKKDKNFIERLKNNILKHNFDIVHVFGGSNTSNACIATKNLNVKLIGYMGSTSIHWHDITAYKTYLNPRLDAVICNSLDNARHFKNQLFFNKNKVHAIYKGYDTNWFNNVESAKLSEYGINENSIVITSVGNVRRVKAMDLFLKAINLLEIHPDKDVHFLLVGKGTANDKMQKLKNSNKHKNKIHLLEHRTDIKEILKRTDVYVQTSIKEGLGRAITESMCLKKPVIVTNAGGCVELVENGVNGYIAKNKDINSISEKINLLLESKEKRKEFGENSYNIVQNTFNIAITVDKTLNLYKLLLNNNN